MTTTENQPLKVLLIGFGTIGQRLAQGLLAHADAVQVVGVLVHDLAAARAAAAGPLAPLHGLLSDQSAEALARGADLVVECAGHGAVDAPGAAALAADSDLLLVSIGALADGDRLARLRDAAQRHGRQLRGVAGAIGGTDWLRAAREAGLDSVVYRGRKPPAAWKGSPAESLVDLDALQAPACFFRGSAQQAATAYPRNANVAATIALATLGLQATQVELWADPQLQDNCHEVEAIGAAGHLQLRLQNQPDPQNPRTSLVTAYSALRAVLDQRAALVL